MEPGLFLGPNDTRSCWRRGCFLLSKGQGPSRQAPVGGCARGRGPGSPEDSSLQARLTLGTRQSRGWGWLPRGLPLPCGTWRMQGFSELPGPQLVPPCRASCRLSSVGPPARGLACNSTPLPTTLEQGGSQQSTFVSDGDSAPLSPAGASLLRPRLPVSEPLVPGFRRRG